MGAHVNSLDLKSAYMSLQARSTRTERFTFSLQRRIRSRCAAPEPSSADFDAYPRMTSPPSPPNWRRRRVVVAAAVLVLVSIGSWCAVAFGPVSFEERFYEFLDDSPRLAKVIRPLFVFVGRG